MMLHTEISVLNEEGEMTEIEVDVEYKYIPLCKGSCDSMGVPEEPDSGDELIIESVVDESGKDWLDLLTETQSKDLTDQCMSDMRDY